MQGKEKKSNQEPEIQRGTAGFAHYDIGRLSELGVTWRFLTLGLKYYFCSHPDLRDQLTLPQDIILILVMKGSVKFFKLFWCSPLEAFLPQ